MVLLSIRVRLGGPVLVLAGALTGAAMTAEVTGERVGVDGEAGRAAEGALYEEPQAQDHPDAGERLPEFVHHRQLPIPARPMNATDRMPAITSVIEVPLTTSGSLASCSFSRTPAISTKASVKPAPAPSA